VLNGHSHELNHVSSTSGSCSSSDAGAPHLGHLHGSSRAYDCLAALSACPYRNTVSPPQLAADAPVADVFQPALVRVLPLARIEHDVSVLPRLESLVGKRLHLHEPLVAQIRLHNGTAAVAVAHGMRYLLLSLEQAEVGKVFDDEFTRFGTRESAVFFRAVVVERSVRIKNIDDFEIIAFAHLPVVRIVRGVIFTMPVPNALSTYASAMSGMVRPVSGSLSFLPTNSLVAFVSRIYRDSRIAEQRLRARRGDLYLVEPSGAGPSAYS
jgi:hypothetical protein